VARPSKLTAETAKKITDALAAGNTRRASAAYGGIDDATFFRWMARYASFATSVTLAEAQAEVAHVANLAQAARAGSITASIFWLERRRGADWGRRDHLEIEIKAAAESVAAVVGADPQWLIRRAGEIAAAAERSAP
jgi:hypothetical protein